MHKKRYNPGRAITVIFIICIVLAVSLLFGQVLGGFYLGNIGKTVPDEVGDIPKRMVLRLTKTPYYSIQAGVFSERKKALLLGEVLAEKGLPAVITRDFRVLIGFLNNQGKMQSLAKSITIDGQNPVIVRGEINAVSFKFPAGDNHAAEEIAPFLGRLSLCLQKGLMLYSSTAIEDKSFQGLKPKFLQLAGELEGVAETGRFLAEKGDASYAPGLLVLSQFCKNWAQSIRELEEKWQDSALMISQQQGLALLHEYHHFMEATN